MDKRLLLMGITLLVMGLLAGCAGLTAPADEPALELSQVTQETDSVPEPEATVAPAGWGELRADTSDVVVAEAIIEPVWWSELHFEVAGTLASVLVQEGDVVQAGETLAQLETADLERAVVQAEINVRQAQLRLEQLQEPPDEAAVEAARASVSDAAAAYEEARMNQTVTEHSVAVGDDVRAARYARDETYRRYQQLNARLDDDDVKVVAAHDDYLDALGAYNRAVETAELRLTSAQNDVTRAYHALEEAQYSLDLLLQGADQADIEAAQLDVEAAELDLESARSRLASATLTAPSDSLVAAVNVDPGDALTTGGAVLVLATLDRLQARTTNLTELDVVRVSQGQPATVTVDALPGQEFDGVVRKVALQPGDSGGEVVYTVIVELVEPDLATQVMWGMTAVVQIATAP